MLGCRVFVFHVEAMRIVLGAAAPGLGWESVLVQAIRRYYADAVQGRWVTVVRTERIERNRRFERWAVLTSRDEVLSVVVREVPTADVLEELAELIESDPPELRAAANARAAVHAFLDAAEAAAALPEAANA